MVVPCEGLHFQYKAQLYHVGRFTVGGSDEGAEDRPTSGNSKNGCGNSGSGSAGFNVGKCRCFAHFHTFIPDAGSTFQWMSEEGISRGRDIDRRERSSHRSGLNPMGQDGVDSPVTSSTSEVVGRTTPTTSSSENSQGELEQTWSFGRVVLAIVPASTKYMAVALGTAAFFVRETFVDDPAVVESSVKPLYEFDGAPAPTITAGWEADLPAATPLRSATGQRLVKTAFTKATEDGSDSIPYLYDPTGTPIVCRDEVTDLLESESKETSWWVVPGVVQRYTVAIPDGPTTQLPCACNSRTTPHVYTGRGGGARGVPELHRPIWLCRRCSRPTYGPDPDQEASRQSRPVDGHPGEGSSETSAPPLDPI